MKSYIFTINSRDGTSRQIRVTAESVSAARRIAEQNANLTPTETLSSPTIVDVGDPAEAGIEEVGVFTPPSLSETRLAEANARARAPADIPIRDQGIGFTDASDAVGQPLDRERGIADADVYQDAFNQFVQRPGIDAATADIMAKTAVQNRFAGQIELPPDDTAKFVSGASPTVVEPEPEFLPTPLELEETSPFAAYLRSLTDLYGSGYGPGERAFGASRVQSGGAPYGFGSYYYPALFEAIAAGTQEPGVPVEELLDITREEARPSLAGYLERMGKFANPLVETRRRAGETLANLASGNVPYPLRDFLGAARPQYNEGNIFPGNFTEEPIVTSALGSMARSDLANRLGGFGYNWLASMLPNQEALASEYLAGTSGRGGAFGGAQNLADYIRRGYGLGSLPTPPVDDNYRGVLTPPASNLGMYDAII